jgi:hypothetical protein
VLRFDITAADLDRVEFIAPDTSIQNFLATRL